jgi:hypothetical protein
VLSDDAQTALRLIRQSQLGVEGTADLAALCGWGGLYTTKDGGRDRAQHVLNELEAARSIRRDGDRWKAD